MTGSGSNIGQLGDFLAKMYGQDRLTQAQDTFATDPGQAAFLANLGGQRVDPQFSQNNAGQTLNRFSGDTGQTDLSSAHMDTLGAQAAQAYAGAAENRAQARAALLPTFSNGTWFDLSGTQPEVHMGPAGAGGGNPPTLNAQVAKMFTAVLKDSTGKPLLEPGTQMPVLDWDATARNIQDFMAWYAIAKERYPDINEAAAVWALKKTTQDGRLPSGEPSPGTRRRVYDPETRTLR